MRPIPGLLLLLLLGLLPATADPEGSPDGCGLDGTWVEVVHRPTRREHPAYLPPADPTTLVIDGHSFVAKAGGRPVRQSLVRPVLGQATEAVDLMTVVGDEFWLTRAIYKVEGDTLTIAEGGRDGDRPTDFTLREFDLGNLEAPASVSVYMRQAK